MSITKAEIDIEFKRAIEQAEELEELSCMLCNISNVKFDNALTLLTNSWKGQNAGSYISNTRSLKNRLYGSAEILKDTAEMIRKTAQRIYMAEMAALMVVESRL